MSLRAVCRQCLSKKAYLKIPTASSYTFCSLILRRCHSSNDQSNKSNTKHFITLSGALLGLLGLYWYYKYKNYWGRLSKVYALSDSDKLSRSQRFNFIADLVEETQNAVVHLEVQRTRGFASVSQGSGFIVRSDGLIITNAHVVASGDFLKVTMSDGKEYEGTIVAVDQVTDLAAVKINATNLPLLKLGKSNKLRPGEWVIAMGSPLNLSNTVTSGIVSSSPREGRQLGMHTKFMEYIQHDASLNKGNSGGPLVNLDGEVIGVNTLVVASGISLAIPADRAADFLKKAEQLQKRVQSRWGFQPSRQKYLGVAMLSLTPSILEKCRELPNFPRDVEHGVLIQKIVVGSSAQRAGLQPMDVITEINGKKIHSTKDVYNAVENNDKLNVILHRGNQTFQANLQL